MPCSRSCLGQRPGVHHCRWSALRRAPTGRFSLPGSADSSALKAQHLLIHPATTNAKGMYRSADHNGANKFEYPVAENGLRYTTVPNWKTQIHGATGFNEAGVGFSGTESILPVMMP